MLIRNFQQLTVVIHCLLCIHTQLSLSVWENCVPNKKSIMEFNQETAQCIMWLAKVKPILSSQHNFSHMFRRRNSKDTPSLLKQITRWQQTLEGDTEYRRVLCVRSPEKSTAFLSQCWTTDWHYMLHKFSWDKAPKAIKAWKAAYAKFMLHETYGHALYQPTNAINNIQ